LCHTRVEGLQTPNSSSGSRHRVVKRSASEAGKSGPSRRGFSLPRFIPPQLSQPVEKPPSGPRWLHEIKLDGFRMAAHIDHGHAQLLTRTGLDWTDKHPSIVAALANFKGEDRLSRRRTLRR
jgi:bifunctional non-homologous end joining protein LigD